MAQGLQKEVAESVGISAQMFNDILKGRKPCPKHTARKLEAEIGINIRVWLFGSDTARAACWLNYTKKVRG